MDAADCFAKFNQRFRSAQGQHRAAAGTGSSNNGGAEGGGDSNGVFAKLALQKAAPEQPQASQQQGIGKQARPSRKAAKENAATHSHEEAPAGIADALGAYAGRGRGKGTRSTALASALNLMQGISSKRQAEPGRKQVQAEEAAPHRLAAASRAAGPTGGEGSGTAEQAPVSRVALSIRGQQPHTGNQGVTARLLSVRECLKQYAGASYCAEPNKEQAEQVVSASRSSGSPAVAPHPAGALQSKQPWHTGMGHDDYFAAARRHLQRVVEAANGIRPGALGSRQLVQLLSAKVDGVVEGLLDAVGEQQQLQQAAAPEPSQPARHGSTRQRSNGAVGGAFQLPSVPSRAHGTHLLAPASGLACGSWRSHHYPSLPSMSSFDLQPTAGQQPLVLTSAGLFVEQPAAAGVAGIVLEQRGIAWDSFLDRSEGPSFPAKKRHKFLPADPAAGCAGLPWETQNGGPGSGFGAAGDLNSPLFQGYAQQNKADKGGDPLVGFSISPSFRGGQQWQQQQQSRPSGAVVRAEPGRSTLGLAGLEEEWVPPWLVNGDVAAGVAAAEEDEDAADGWQAVHYGQSHSSWKLDGHEAIGPPAAGATWEGWQLGAQQEMVLGAPQLSNGSSLLETRYPLSWLKDA